MMPFKPARIGERFGRLTVIGNWVKEINDSTRVGGYKNASMADCRCKCGTLVAVRLTDLRFGSTKSCGCWAVDHGTLQAAHNNQLNNFTRDRNTGRFKSLSK